MKPPGSWHLMGLACLLLAACGSSAQQGDGGPAPPATATVATLSGAQLGALCDQLAATEGGYSHPKMLACDGGTSTLTFNIGTNQTQCKQALGAVAASCGTLTVGDLQGCVTDTYAQTCADILLMHCRRCGGALIGG